VTVPEQQPVPDEAVRALMRFWIDQFNAERYIGGPSTSPMVEPDELDIDDPPDGTEDMARHEVAVVAPFIRAPLEAENARLRRLIDRYRRPMPDGGHNWRERAHTAHVRACDAEAENARLRERLGRTCNCEWDNIDGLPVVICGYHATQLYEARAQVIRELRDAASDQGPQSAYWLAADYLERK
jgi:hypothetical protein